MDDRIYAGRLTARGAVRVHRLALSVMDLAAVRNGVVRPGPGPGAEDVAAALQLRLGDPLALDVIEVRAG